MSQPAMTNIRFIAALALCGGIGSHVGAVSPPTVLHVMGNSDVQIGHLAWRRSRYVHPS